MFDSPSPYVIRRDDRKTPWSPLGTVLWTAALVLAVLALANFVLDAQASSRAPEPPATTTPVTAG